MGKTWVIKNSDGYPKLEVEAESFKAAVEKVKDKLPSEDLVGTASCCANLKGANLKAANLIGADLSEAKGLPKNTRDAYRVQFRKQEKGKENANNYRRSDNNMAAD